MGQREVYEWLLSRRLAGDHRFFSRKEIEAQVGRSYRLSAQIDALYLFRYLEVRMEGFDNRRYRLRSSQVKAASQHMTSAALPGSMEGSIRAGKAVRGGSS